MKSTTTSHLPCVLNHCALLIGVLLAIATMMPHIAFSQYFNPAPVPLLTAGTYGALAYSGITGTANINGDIGTITGSIDPTINCTGTNWGMGTTHNGQAQTDLAAALVDASGRTIDYTIPGNALGTLNLGRGVYGGGALDLAANTTLTLNGSATDVFIIIASSSLTINVNSTVSITGGAVWSNVFWYVGTSATIFSGSTFNGNILARASITLNATATQVTGRLLANTGLLTINSNVLPVELTSFTAALNNNAVELNWKTVTEVNNYGFEIERNGHSVWNKIGFVSGAGTSNTPKSYSFIDKNVTSGVYWYRLKQIDRDGSYEYFEEREVTIRTPGKFVLGQNYPNPFGTAALSGQPATKIKYSIPSTEKVLISVYDVFGKEVQILWNDTQNAGSYEIELDAGNLTSGLYFYRVVTGMYSETRRMILLR